MKEFLVKAPINDIEQFLGDSFARGEARKCSDLTITHTYFKKGDDIVDIKETEDNILTDFDPDFPELAPYICEEKSLSSDNYKPAGHIGIASKKYKQQGYTEDLTATIHQIGITSRADSSSQLVFLRQYSIDYCGKKFELSTASFGDDMFHNIADADNNASTMNEQLHKICKGLKSSGLSFATDDLYRMKDFCLAPIQKDLGI